MHGDSKRHTFSSLSAYDPRGKQTEKQSITTGLYQKQDLSLSYACTSVFVFSLGLGGDQSKNSITID